MLSNATIATAAVVVVVVVDMNFSEEKMQLLKDEIAEYDDAIAFQLHIVDAGSGEGFGLANVEIWVMVEEAVNILRQVRMPRTFTHSLTRIR